MHCFVQIGKGTAHVGGQAEPQSFHIKCGGQDGGGGGENTAETNAENSLFGTFKLHE